MANPKMFTLLNPKTSRIDGAGGGVPHMTREDLNLACGCADKAGVELLMRKWAGLRTPQTRAFYGLYTEICALAVRFNWKIREKPIEKIRSLLQLAIFETTNPLMCPDCKGTAKELDMVKMIPVDCTSCQGSGLYTIEPRDMAKVIGISRKAWDKGDWAERYKQIKILVQTKEKKALNKIYKKLQNDLT